MARYCCSCRSAVERGEYIWFKMSVFALYNAVGGRRRKNSWRESKYLCDECYEIFIEDFITRCEEGITLPPAPSEEDKSSPCDDCGEHQFKNDPYVRLEFYGVVGDIEHRQPDACVSVCYECFEYEFSRFTIDTVEPLKQIPTFSRRQSKGHEGVANQAGVIKSLLGKMRGNWK